MQYGGVLSSFLYARQVQFADTDLAGVVHFTWIAKYMEEAEHALWRAAGLSIAVAGSPLRYPRVSVAIDFKAPLYFEDTVEDHVTVAAMSTRTITYAHTLTRGAKVVATGTMTAVCVHQDGSGLRAVELPDEVRAKLAVAGG
jgi:YbgC/YbaW family acyl-CoA thioester hydrolase